MASFSKFEPFVAAIANKVHNLGSDTLKLLLTNSAPSASNSQKSQLTEISAGNGYSAGGATVTITGSTQSSGTYSLVGTDVTITASGGTIGPFRYAVLYNDTATNDELIGYWDRGSNLTLQDGDSFTLDLGSSILTIA